MTQITLNIPTWVWVAYVGMVYIGLIGVVAFLLSAMWDTKSGLFWWRKP